MPLTILLYEPETAEPISLTHWHDALDKAGAEWESAGSPDYTPWSWTHPHCGACCTGDLGTPPLEEDELHPPATYEGWRPCQVSINIPLTGPHWCAVEVGRWLERLLNELPEVAIINTEDTEREDGTFGPYMLDRPRLLASWEQLHLAQTEKLTGFPRMARISSLALWRYRLEQAAGASELPSIHWPRGVALQAGHHAHSAVIWSDPNSTWALPPVEYVVVGNVDKPGLIPVEKILEHVSDTDGLGYGAAQRITPSDALKELFAAGGSLTTDDFTALGDLDWSD